MNHPRFADFSDLDDAPAGRVRGGLDRVTGLLVRVHGLERLPADDRARLLDDARRLSRVSHLHLERVVEVGDDHVMVEHADGIPLARAPRPSLEEALLIGEQLAGALAAVHAAGLAHRAFDGHAAVYLGQGAVKVSGAGLTPPAVPGDAAGDQLALGRVLFALIGGVAPGPDARLADACPGVPLDIAQAVERALAGRPEDRFPSIQDLEHALQAAYARLTGAPLIMRVRTGPIGPAPVRARRRRGFTARGDGLPILPVAPEAIALALGLVLLIGMLVTVNNLGQGVLGGVASKPAASRNQDGGGTTVGGGSLSLGDVVVGGASKPPPPPPTPVGIGSECHLPTGQVSDAQVQEFIRCRMRAWLRAIGF